MLSHISRYISGSVTRENVSGETSEVATLSMNGVNKTLSSASSLFGGLISSSEAGHSSNVDWSAAVSNLATQKSC